MRYYVNVTDIESGESWNVAWFEDEEDAMGLAKEYEGLYIVYIIKRKV